MSSAAGDDAVRRAGGREDRAGPEEAWYDEAAGPLVRPYALTGGRTDSARVRLDLITYVVAVGDAADPGRLPPEQQRILELSRTPVSVVELGASLRLPIVVTKVLVADLIDSGLLVHRAPAMTDLAPDRRIIQAVLNGLRSL